MASNCRSGSSTTAPTRAKNFRTRTRSLFRTLGAKHTGVNPRPILHTGLGIARAQCTGPSHARKLRNGTPAAKLTHNFGAATPHAATSLSIPFTDAGRTATISISARDTADFNSRAISTRAARPNARSFSGWRSYTTISPAYPASRNPATRALVIRPPPRNTVAFMSPQRLKAQFLPRTNGPAEAGPFQPIPLPNPEPSQTQTPSQPAPFQPRRFPTLNALSC